MALLSFFTSFSFLSFTFLFNLFCFSSLCQRVVLLNFLDTKVNPNSLLFSERERERERESPKSSCEEGGREVRWCWVNFNCRCPTNLDHSRTRGYCAYSRCGLGLFGHFFLSSIAATVFTLKFRTKMRVAV